MKTATFIIALLVCSAAYAQEAPTRLPLITNEGNLTTDQQLKLREAQVEYLQAKSASDTAHAQVAQIDANAQKAQAAMGALVSQHCKDAGLKDGECMVCDGPGVTDEQKAACAGVKPQELAIRRMPAKKDEKAEAKKP
jgi:hypothetical protein